MTSVLLECEKITGACWNYLKRGFLDLYRLAGLAPSSQGYVAAVDGFNRMLDDLGGKRVAGGAPDVTGIKTRGRFLVMNIGEKFSWFFSNDGENPLPENVCVCLIASLMTAGCKCGQMTRERG